MVDGQAGRPVKREPNYVCLGFFGLAQALLLFWEPRLPLRGPGPLEEKMSLGQTRGTFGKSRLQLATVVAWDSLLFVLILFSCPLPPPPGIVSQILLAVLGRHQPPPSDWRLLRGLGQTQLRAFA